MQSLLDLFWRLGLRLAYPLARLYWSWLRPDVRGTYVFVWHAGRVLLTRNSYRRGLIAPGGMVRTGEDPESTVVRELAEETGISVVVDQLHYLGKAPKKDPRGFGSADMFEVHLEEEPQLVIDHREVVWAGLLDPGEALTQELEFATGKYLARVQQTGSYTDVGPGEDAGAGATTSTRDHS